MGLHNELREGLDEDRDTIVEILARHHAVPAEVEENQVETANLLGGGSETTDFQIRRYDKEDEGQLVDRQTRKLVIEKLGIETVDDCENVVEEIKNHDAW